MRLPRAQLDTAWFVGLLTLGNTGVLANATNATRIELWILGVVVLLLAMASMMAERHPEKGGHLTQFVEALEHAQAEFMGKVRPPAKDCP